MKEKTQRQLQASEQIKRIIADHFSREGLSAIMGSYVTILRADVSPDMKNCKIFVDIFGDEAKNDDILARLNGMAANLRFALSQKLAMRNCPELHFVLDGNSQYALDIEARIEEEKGE